jgi:hypothetical protein
MSAYTYGAFAKKREKATRATQGDRSDSTTNEPPGLSTTVDSLIAIVPVEVVGVHALAVTFLSDKWTLIGIYTGCIVLCLALYVVGHLSADPDVDGIDLLRKPRESLWRRPHALDGVRIALPVLAFVAWTMLSKETAWDEIFPDMKMGTRYFWGLIAAIVVLIAAKVIAVIDNDLPSR